MKRFRELFTISLPRKLTLLVLFILCFVPLFQVHAGICGQGCRPEGLACNIYDDNRCSITGGKCVCAYATSCLIGASSGVCQEGYGTWQGEAPATCCGGSLPPTATPASSGGGGSCSGSCMAPAANCGSYGMVSASGSCSGGQLCCTSSGGPLPFCPANVNAGLFPFPGYAGTNCGVIGDGSHGPYGCCQGLEWTGVGGGSCQCPSVANICQTSAPPSVTIAVGQTARVPLNIIREQGAQLQCYIYNNSGGKFTLGANNNGYNFSRPIYADVVGTSVGSGPLLFFCWAGVSAHCDSTVTVNVTAAVPTSTPTPPLTAVTFNASCPAPGTNLSVSWSNVTGASQYYISVDDTVIGGTFPQSGEYAVYIPSGTTNRSFASTAGRTYTIGMSPINSAGVWGPNSFKNVTCSLPGPTNTPTRTPTPTPIGCNAGFTCFAGAASCSSIGRWDGTPTNCSGGKCCGSLIPTPTPTSAPIPVVDLKANNSDGPITIAYNTSANLTWTSSNASTCTATIGWTGSKATSGSQSTGNLTSAQTYTLSCTGSGGTRNDSVVVNVNSAPTSTPTNTPTRTPTPTPPVTTCNVGFACYAASNCASIGRWDGTPTNCSGGKCCGNLIATPTPTPVPPVACNQACGTCQAGLSCIGGVCRNSSCSSQTNCICPGITPTNTPTRTPTPTTPPSSCPVGFSCYATSSCATINRWDGGASCSLGRCCGNLIATPTATPTPTPATCAQPFPDDPGATACVNMSANRNINWSWDPVPGATEYQFAVRDMGTSTIIQGPTWMTAAALGCATGKCRTTTSHTAGTYRSEVSARGTCLASLTSPSPNVDISYCPATIRARAVRVPAGTLSCNTVFSATNYQIPSTISLNPAGGTTPQVQNTSAYVEWNNSVPVNGVNNPVTVNVIPPPDSVEQMVCWRSGATQGSGYTKDIDPSETVLWDIGYAAGSPWTQVIGADVTACQNIQSFIPANASPPPRAFVQNGTGGYPGIISFGGTYDFDSNTSSTGQNLSSTSQWVIRETTDACTTNWYQYFENHYGVSQLPIYQNNPVNPIPKPASSDQPYRIEGNVSTNGNWIIDDDANNDGTNGDSEHIVIFVNGNLTINGNITIPGNGFIAFIVNGNIIVSNNVGNPVGTTTPNIQGVYVTSPGTLPGNPNQFMTGQSTVPNKERLIVKGIVIAGGFDLKRDLDLTGANPTTPSEQFIYDPKLLINLPDEFRESKVTWQEVAP